jgi:RNA polymerase sigma-70 factor (ECF subfamily)
VREELCRDAIRLGRVLHELVPDDPEAMGLLALMLLIDARRAARTSADGALVRLPEQDRSRWDHALVAEGQALVRRCLALGRPGPYQLQAAVNAVHADARRSQDTDWRQILALYDQHLAIAPSPIVALHRTVALAEVEGPAAALAALDALTLPPHHLAHAIRADFLSRLGGGALPRRLAPERVAAAMAGRRVDPRRRVRRHARRGPPLERRRERVLHRLLGRVDVAAQSHQHRDDTAVLLAEDALDLRRSDRRHAARQPSTSPRNGRTSIGSRVARA